MKIKWNVFIGLWKAKEGSSILTTPIIIAIGMMMVSMLILLAVQILTPYLWYEKLSSTCLQYLYVMEEYGYLTNKEATALKNDLVRQGFQNDGLKMKYTNYKTNYGDPISLKIEYQYLLKLPLMEPQLIPMSVERHSVSKR